MHAPDGTNYPNKIIFDEVKAPERLAYRHGDDGENMEEDQFHVVVDFSDEGKGTRLSMWFRFKSEAVRDQLIREFHILEGNEQTIDRLEAELAKRV